MRKCKVRNAIDDLTKFCIKAATKHAKYEEIFKKMRLNTQYFRLAADH